MVWILWINQRCKHIWGRRTAFHEKRPSWLSFRFVFLWHYIFFHFILLNYILQRRLYLHLCFLSRWDIINRYTDCMHTQTVLRAWFLSPSTVSVWLHFIMLLVFINFFKSKVEHWTSLFPFFMQRSLTPCLTASMPLQCMSPGRGGGHCE